MSRPMPIEVNEEQKVFIVDKIDPILLYGVADGNLKLIENKFPVQIIARGNQIKIIGPTVAVNTVEANWYS